ncbi:MAG: flagellar biosynthetic protein FliR [Eubacterium sp.]|nr:flagellar biosynthetic protein FliR [Eubacterium sp.]
MDFTVENFEYYMLVVVRIAAFVGVAPLFNYRGLSAQMKVGISIVLSAIVIPLTPVVELNYTGIIGFSALILKEIMVGLILGFMCSACTYILNFAGQLMDIDMGLSMASTFDPINNQQVTVTGLIYNNLFMLMLIATNMHYYIIRAIVDTFKYFNVGQEVFPRNMVEVGIDFIINFFIIGFRITLPMFCAMFLINIILGILARIAPQMNMFVVGMQIKLIVGFFVLILLVQTLPTVSDFVFDEMKRLITDVIHGLTPPA